MTFNVSDFTSNLINDGARPNLFQVTMATLPAALGGNGTNSANAPARRLSFMARAAQIPGSSVGVVPMFYFGREIKLAGNRTFPEWTITIINDEDFSIRNSMETWMNYINSHTGNLRGQGNAPGTGSAGIAGYTTDATVEQFGKSGNSIQKYNFVSMFPIDISPIDLNWESNNAIEEFSVTFAYQYWTNTNSTT